MRQICETWAVSYERVVDFLLSHGAEQDESGHFTVGRVDVCVTVLSPRQVGRLSFLRTRVEFSGEKNETEELHRQFVLCFISAGG